MDEDWLTRSADVKGDGWAIPDGTMVAHRETTMDPNAPAEELPALYRAILDRVAMLEAAGDRAEALRVRGAATKAYSRAWDERARRDLEALLRRVERPTTSERTRDRSPRRPLARPSRTAAAPER